MDKKDVKKFVKNSKAMGALSGYNSLSILSKFAVMPGTIATTTLQMFCFIKNEMKLESGIYSQDGLKTELSLEDYPQSPVLEYPLCSFDTTGETLNSVQKYVSDDDTRYFLQGALFDKGTLVATNGRMLFLESKIEHKLFEDSYTYKDFVKENNDRLPIIRIPKLAKKIKDVKVTIYTEWTEFVFILDGLEYTVVSQNIEGQFPQYQRIVNDMPDFVSNWTVTKDVLEYAKLTKEPRSNRVFIENKTVKNAFSGDLVIKTPMRFAINQQYLQIAYDTVGSDALVNDAERPVFFKKGNRIGMIQPMMLDYE